MSIKLKPITNLKTNTIDIPGSKSYTNRALIMAALSPEPVKIIDPLKSDDTEAMVNCLRQLGIEVEVGEEYFLVKGSIADVVDKEYELDANISGTTIRFILALLCIVPGVKILKGREGLNKRPIGELVDGLTQLGAQIEYLDKEGFPPLKITSSKLNVGTTKLNGDISSQYFSAIIMIAPLIGGATIEVEGNQISKPYIDMTIDGMTEFGIEGIENKDYECYIIPSSIYQKSQYKVEGDFSGAGYFFAIAALNNLNLKLTNLNSKTAQGDIEFIKILEQMGNKIEYGENYISIEGNGVKAINVDMENCPDQVQTLAVLAAFAEGTTNISGVRSLRVKETERVEAIKNELAKMDIKTEDTNDTITIYGGDPKPAEIDTYGDHRMAMSFAVAGTKIDGITINNSEVVSKTFPDYWEKLKKLGVQIT